MLNFLRRAGRVTSPINTTSTHRSLFSLDRGVRRPLHLLNRWIAATPNVFAVSQEALRLFERKQSIGRFLSTPTMYGQDEDREPSTFFDFVEIGETSKVQQLLEADPGLAHAKDTVHRNGTTALLIASRCGHTDIIRSLVDSGSDVDAAGPWGFTALTYSVLFGQRDVVELLLSLGADTTKVDKQAGLTAWLHAKREGKEDLASLVWSRMTEEERRAQHEIHEEAQKKREQMIRRMRAAKQKNTR